ncbi:hypothetical protein HHK36_030830 [Tetracentron sinense]|uniref:Phosphatidylinositol N-acetylglucosaminyltransferase subunit H conserved domain-containing protein n=1 Tax=Tetracentron sinense TaxID=13715 RepID=A0A834Y8B2_TETSI|nr:hypothetical protein HHK36_030830 [Tetracentron sinense]
MADVRLTSARYTYVHNDHKDPFLAIDTHHIAVRKSIAKIFLIYLSILLLLTNTFYVLLETSSTIFLWSILLGAFLVKSLHWKPVERDSLDATDLFRESILMVLSFYFVFEYTESVVVMPAFGVQLETPYGSGRIIRRFVPIGKILKPVLNECVTPVTCYWSLALIIHGEEELMLVFKVKFNSCGILGIGLILSLSVRFEERKDPKESIFLLAVESLFDCPRDMSEPGHPNRIEWDDSSSFRICKIRILNKCHSAVLLILVSLLAHFIVQELRPPVKMLVPIWKALCAATDSKEAQI